MRKPKTLGHAAPLSGCADTDAVLPLLSYAGVQCKRSWPAACRDQHSFVGFYPHIQVGRDHGTAKGPPLGAFYLAPHQRENKGIPSATTTTVKVSKSSMSISPGSPETSRIGEHYDRAALSDGVIAVTGFMDFLRLRRRRRFPPARYDEDLAALRRRSPGHPVSQ
jgi:hypothetical protein